MCGVLAIAALGAATVLSSAAPWGEVAAILLGGLAGLILCRKMFTPVIGRIATAVSPTMGAAMLAVFALLLVGLPLAASRSHTLAVFEAFYRSGALVFFGGGHVGAAAAA